MKVIVYDSIEKKNLADNRKTIAISSQEALIQTLNLMDLYSKLNSGRNTSADNEIPWIILKEKRHANQ